MSESLVLHGAGACGGYALKHLRSQGIEPLAFADNDPSKQGTTIDGVRVLSVQDADREFAWAQWVATAISRPAAQEIRGQIKSMGLRTKPLWECIPVCHGLPSNEAWRSTYSLCSDIESDMQWRDQMKFRANPDYDAQIDPTPCSELYFPDFIKKLDSEIYCDAGAADGDSIDAFWKRWPNMPGKFHNAVALEPDPENMKKLQSKFPATTAIGCAIGDFDGEASFVSTGDYSAHLTASRSRDAKPGNTVTVPVRKLDSLFGDSNCPTYIKMDIEGAELEALWGARKLIKKHSPVLAVCAYHTSDHVWELPLLIHALNPDYKLYFRRYGEGAFEIVWYAVPPSRVIGSTSPISYSDDHVG